MRHFYEDRSIYDNCIDMSQFDFTDDGVEMGFGYQIFGER